MIEAALGHLDVHVFLLNHYKYLLPMTEVFLHAFGEKWIFVYVENCGGKAAKYIVHYLLQRQLLFHYPKRTHFEPLGSTEIYECRHFLTFRRHAHLPVARIEIPSLESLSSRTVII